MDFRPALIIGLGGTGFKVAKDLENRMELCGADPTNGPVRFLYADSDMTGFPQGDRRCVHLTVDAITVAEQIRSHGDYNGLHVKQWHHPTLTQNLLPTDFDRGVAGRRPNGRLAFLASNRLAELCQGITGTLTQLLALYPGARIMVSVLASAGGGTGSGCFIDCGYLVQSLALAAGYTDHVQVDGHLLLAAPGLNGDTNKMFNSMAILRELDHFSDRREVFHARYPTGDLRSILGAGCPFTHLFLAAPKDEDGRVLDPQCSSASAMEVLVRRTSDCLFVRLLRSTDLRLGAAGAGEIDSRMMDILNTNTGPGANKEDPLGYPMAFFTFGVGLRHFPVEACKVIFRDRLRADLAASWRDSRPMDATQKDLFEKDVQALRKEFGLYEHREVSPSQPGPDFVPEARSSSSDKVYVRLVKGESGQADPVDLESYFTRLAKTRAEVDQLVEVPQAGGVTPEQGQPGFLVATLANRRPAEQRRQSELLREGVLKAASDPARGPSYAERLLAVLGVDLEVELALIERVVQASVSDEGDASFGTHPLLLFWAGFSKKRDAEDASGSLSAYAKARYERVVLAQKTLLFRDLQQQVESLRAKELQTFNSSMERWQSREHQQRQVLEGRIQTLAAQGEALPALAGVKRLVYPQQYLDGIYNGILNSLRGADGANAVAPGLGPVQADGAHPEGFGPFQPVEERLEAAVEQALGGLSVLALMEAQGETPQAGAAKMVGQARNLLHMTLTAAGYVNFLTGAPHDLFPILPWRRFYLRSVPPDTAWSEAVKGALAGAQATGMPQDMELDAGQPGLAAVVSIRSAFPTRILVGFSPQERETWLGQGDPSIHFIDMRVLPPLTPELRRESEGLLLLSELLFLGAGSPPIQVVNQGNMRTYRVQDPQAAGQQMVAEISSDFAKATRQLANHSELRRCLRGNFQILRDDAGRHGPWHQKLSRQLREWNETLMALSHPAQRQGLVGGTGALTGVPVADAVSAIMVGARAFLGLDIRPQGEAWYRFNDQNGHFECIYCSKTVGTQAPQNADPDPGQHESRCPWYRIQTGQV